MTHNQQEVEFEDLTDTADGLEDCSGHRDTEQHAVQYELLTVDMLQKATTDTVKLKKQKLECEVLTDNGEALEDNGAQSDREPTDGIG